MVRHLGVRWFSPVARDRIFATFLGITCGGLIVGLALRARAPPKRSPTPSFAWTTVPLGVISPACPVDRRADVARWRHVALRTVVAECRRADARANLQRFVDLLAAGTDWDNLTVMLTLTDAAAALGISERTVTSMYARLFGLGLLVERVPPRSAAADRSGRLRSQARVCRLWLARDAEPTFERCEVCGTAGDSVVPRPVPLYTACCDACWNWALAKTQEGAEPTVADPHAPTTTADLATLPVGPGGCSCSSACRHQASAPRSRAAARHRPCWGKFDQAGTRSERLLFAERLRAETALANDRRLSNRQLRCLLRPFVTAGWTVGDVLWALDHTPDGTPHAYAWASASHLRNPSGWLGWRLSHWRALKIGVLAPPLG
jgi:hypothetical protein